MIRRAAKWILAFAVATAVILITITLPRLVITGMRVPLPRGLEDVGVYDYEEVAFPAHDQAITLRGWWLPAAGERATVIVVHGSGGNRAVPLTMIPELSRDLRARGFSVLAIDMRNHGASDSSHDGVVSFGPAEANDVIGAVDFVRGRDPSARIAALGFSMGGSAVLYAAAADRRIEAVVAVGTYAEVASVLPAAVRGDSGLPWFLPHAVVWSLEHLHGWPISRARGIEVAPSLRAGSLLLIHNEADHVVPIDHTRRLAAAAPGAEVWIAPIPPADDPIRREQDGLPMHAAEYRLHPAEFVDRVVAHFERVLGE